MPNSSSIRPAWQACGEYWRLYLAWIRSKDGSRERDAGLQKLKDHLAVCGCRMGLGGQWSPHDEPVDGAEEDKRGGYVLEGD